MADTFNIGFPDVSMAQGNRYAESLARALQDTDPDVKVERHRTQENTLDFGASLILVLGTASATAIARGIAHWLEKNSGARIEITSDGRVVATNIESRDASKIAEAFTPHSK